MLSTRISPCAKLTFAHKFYYFLQFIYLFFSILLNLVDCTYKRREKRKEGQYKEGQYWLVFRVGYPWQIS